MSSSRERVPFPFPLPQGHGQKPATFFFSLCALATPGAAHPGGKFPSFPWGKERAYRFPC